MVMAVVVPGLLNGRGDLAYDNVASISAVTLALFESGEAQSAGLKEGIVVAVDVHSPELLQTSTVELQALEAWRDVPDVDKGDVGELTAPAGGDADATAQGHEGVAQLLAAVEAFVGVAPYAVHGMVALRFSQHIFKCDLQMVIDVVGVAVHKIDFGRHCCRLRFL